MSHKLFIKSRCDFFLFFSLHLFAFPLCSSGYVHVQIERKHFPQFPNIASHRGSLSIQIRETKENKKGD